MRAARPRTPIWELKFNKVEAGGRRSLTIGRSGPVVSFRSMSGDLHVVRPVAASAPMPEDHRAASTTSGPRSDGPPSAGGAGSPAITAAYDGARLRILRSLERGEI